MNDDVLARVKFVLRGEMSRKMLYDFLDEEDPDYIETSRQHLEKLMQSGKFPMDGVQFQNLLLGHDLLQGYLKDLKNGKRGG